MRELCCSIVSALLVRSLYVFFIFQFGVVGATLGAIAGAVIGWRNNMRLMEGTIIGIVSGATFSYNLTKATFNHLHSDDDDDRLAFLVHLAKLITRDLEKILCYDDEHKILEFNKAPMHLAKVILAVVGWKHCD